MRRRCGSDFPGMEITGAKRPALKNSTIGATYEVRKDKEARPWDDLPYWVKKFRFYSTGHGEQSKNIRHRHNLSSLAFQVDHSGGCGKERFQVNKTGDGYSILGLRNREAKFGN